jgi:peptidoglycan hydrolase CwlO-like protein
MKKWIPLLILSISLASCGAKKTEEKPEMTAEQELQVVDSATMETKERIEDISKSVDNLQNEVDSLLNEINKK